MNKTLVLAVLLVVLLVAAAFIKMAMEMNRTDATWAIDAAEETHERPSLDDFEDGDRVLTEREESLEEARERIRNLTGRTPN